MKPAVTLNTGYEMPLVGFGTYMLTNPIDDEEAVITAVKSGYRLIDTAQAYKNEEIIGKALKQCPVPREDIFVTTKIWFPAINVAKVWKIPFVNWISTISTWFSSTGRITMCTGPGVLWSKL